MFKVVYATFYVDAANYGHNMFIDTLLQGLSEKIERVDLRYISERPTLSDKSGWNDAGRLEAIIRLTRRIGEDLRLSQAEIDQRLSDSAKRLSEPTAPRAERAEERETYSQKKQQASAQPSTSGVHPRHPNHPVQSEKQAGSGQQLGKQSFPPG